MTSTERSIPPDSATPRGLMLAPVAPHRHRERTGTGTGTGTDTGTGTGTGTGTTSALACRAPDGAFITMAAPGHDLAGRWSADVLVRLRPSRGALPRRRGLRELHITPIPGLGGALADGPWLYEREAQGGRLLFGHGDTGAQGIAVWRGRRYQVTSRLTGAERPVDPFDGLAFADEPYGLRVRSRTPWSEYVEAREVTVHVPGVGPVHIRAARSAPESVPTVSGARLRVGEVWQQRTSSTEVMLLHVTETTVATLPGTGPGKGDIAARYAFLKALTELSWSRAIS